MVPEEMNLCLSSVVIRSAGDLSDPLLCVGLSGDSRSKLFLSRTGSCGELYDPKSWELLSME